MSFKVLIVDGSKSARESLAAAVEKLDGFACYTSASGFEALKILPRHRFDIIITDLNPPDINGLELINFVKKNPRYRDTPLFVVSAEPSERERAQGLALGASEFLAKPFEPETLIALIRFHMRLG